MAPLYETLAASSVLELDQKVLDSMRVKIDDELKKLDENDVYMVWQEVPILVIVSMLAYFCFIEQLLVANMGTSAIALSLPFSCVLGLLSSMTSSTMVRRRFVWLYASVQFAFVVIFAHIFYSVVNVQPVLSILLATFAGCVVAMSGSSIIVEIVKLKRRWWHNRPDQQINSLSSLVHAVLLDKQPDEVPIILESLLSKVMEEFEHRIASQVQLQA